MNQSVTQPDPPPTAPRRRRRGLAWIVTIVFAVLILIPSMLGFVMKFMELISLTQGEADGGFAITPVVNYLFASAGFFFLLLWAAINGMFNDLEEPKYLMLENEKRLDARPDSGGRS
ncbi:MAG: hypothetical protein RIK87_01380 [Fuerstiella sp.]